MSFLFGKSNNVHLLGVGLVIFPQKVCILKLFIDCKNGNASLVRQTRYKIIPKMNAMGSSLPVLCIKSPKSNCLTKCGRIEKMKYGSERHDL